MRDQFKKTISEVQKHDINNKQKKTHTHTLQTIIIIDMVRCSLN